MKKGYKKFERVISKEYANSIAASLLIAEAQGLSRVDDKQVKGASIFYANPMCEVLLLDLLPMMEEATGKKLLPTYSFARVYRRGHELMRHTDRPSCEYSATITLGKISKGPWPIFMDGESIDLEDGDLAIYKGCEVTHWREIFKGEIWIQLFLHYVEFEGKHHSHRFDGRQINSLYESIYGYFLKR